MKRKIKLLFISCQILSVLGYGEGHNYLKLITQIKAIMKKLNPR